MVLKLFDIKQKNIIFVNLLNLPVRVQYNNQTIFYKNPQLLKILRVFIFIGVKNRSSRIVRRLVLLMLQFMFYQHIFCAWSSFSGKIILITI